MTKVENVDEALKLLNTLVERGESVEENVASNPNYSWFPGSELEQKWLMAAQRLVPAMVKGARAVLEIQKLYDNDNLSEVDGWMGRGVNITISALANAYRPAMVELGWVK